MCLAIPAKVLTVDGLEGDVELGGITRRVNLQLTPDAREGDYVLLHTGYAISVIDEDEARETLEMFRELENTLEPEA
ncbi:MAG: HypC/HybG/HupF family hydrogenase formation chaperone [Pseudomonadota bacterium]